MAPDCCPKQKSVNDGIPKKLCSLTYITIDDAVRKIVQLGPGSKDRYEGSLLFGPS